MKHDIQIEQHGALGGPMAQAVQTCVHCGFCLPACPTYQLLGQEMDSPRGRIVLMKEVLEGSLDVDDAAPHIDACLGCLACEPACPSGVAYRDLISPFRAIANGQRKRSMFQRIQRTFVMRTLPYPGRLRWAFRIGRWIKPFSRWLPKTMRPMLELIPAHIPPKQRLAEKTSPVEGQPRARVALLTGCAQSVLDPDINSATIDVLTRNGVEVLVPPTQTCCGSLSWHVGNIRQAQRFATATLRAFPDDVDAIVTNAAGCGTGMQEYGLICKDTPVEERAARFSERVCDVSVFLDRLGDLASIPDRNETIRAAYQDACHLSHGQGASQAPRRLLQTIPGLQLVPVPEAHLCCGSAGTYNIDEPEIATKLGAQKARHILSCKPDIVASGNIGCIVQLRLHLSKQKSETPVRHTMQILRDAYQGS